MSDILLLDSCVGSGLFLDLNESSSNGRTRFRGKFQEANAINKNNMALNASPLWTANNCAYENKLANKAANAI